MNAHEMNNKMSNTVNKTSKWTQTEHRSWKNNHVKPQSKHRRTHQKRGSGTDNNLQNINNSETCQIWQEKTMKQSVKLLQKAKEARMCMLYAKTQEVQQNNHTSIRVDTYKYRLKNAKIQQCKKLLHWFGNFRTINNKKKSEENPTSTKHAYKTIVHAQSYNTQTTVHQHLMKCTRKPGQRRLQHFWQITSS